MIDGLQTFGSKIGSDLAFFAERLGYVAGEFGDPATYAKLAAALAAVEQRIGTRGNVLFYLATPPTFFAEICKQLAAAGGATTGADQAQAYARLTHMLKDAVDIAPAVGGLSPLRAGKAKASSAQCPATRDF